ncbi:MULTISPECIES: LytR C-terminal domain-containing protein [Arthrobacter]|uniref:LytR C-terminal domain-containing protein n=1 Tax=Arthrobacter TaxID=1663 RepID=UPI0012B55F44|nr:MULTISPECIES: LytR C-terminal domain-containing protein [Arthrobacter]
MSNYPRDEFDRVPENSARHGVHRASLETPTRSLVPLMIFGVAALCIGVLAFFVVPKIAGNDTAAPPPPVGQSTAATTAQTSSDVLPSPTSSATPTTTQAPTPEPTAAPTPDSVVDKSTPVAVYNGTGTPGLAAKYAALVTAGGWTVSQSANWGGLPQATSVIFYSGVTQKANAQALGTLLNITNLVDTAELKIPLTVVLGPGA